MSKAAPKPARRVKAKAAPARATSRAASRARTAAAKPPSGTAHAPVVLDIAGTTLTAADRRRLRHPLTGGLILFARNWENRQQLTELTAAIKAERADILISVDHEGGRVQRFKTDGFTHLPPMRALGQAWMRDALTATDAATATGYVLGAELRACGVDFSFTPVLDLDHGESSVIGDRSFHRDARVATMLAKSVMHGLLQAGMGNCGKHFPGHGFVVADSHVTVPVDKRSLKAILADCALPYTWLSTTLSSVMPAHVIYPKVDHHPAGFSPRWLQEILRGDMGFQGAIFSDDLSMEGAKVAGGHVDAAMAALNAGCDMVLLCNQSVDGGQAVDGLLDGLLKAQQAGQWRANQDAEVRRLALLPQSPPMPWDELMHHLPYQHALARLP
jgi:beta-N-acetylhexosaminidase